MFNEFNTVEQMAVQALQAQGWQYVPGKDLPRKSDDLILWDHLRDALIRLNPEITANQAHADDVVYRLRAILVGVRQDGLVRSNEAFFDWLTGEKTMPFGPNGEHVTVRLIDFEKPADPARNQLVVANQVTFRPPGSGNDVRFDVVLYVNGLPLVVGEAKTPTRPAVTWVDGAADVHYYQNVAREFFAPNVLSFATEGKDFRYGSIFLPLEIWAPW